MAQVSNVLEIRQVPRADRANAQRPTLTQTNKKHRNKCCNNSRLSMCRRFAALAPSLIRTTSESRMRTVRLCCWFGTPPLTCCGAHRRHDDDLSQALYHRDGLQAAPSQSCALALCVYFPLTRAARRQHPFVKVDGEHILTSDHLSSVIPRASLCLFVLSATLSPCSPSRVIGK